MLGWPLAPTIAAFSTISIIYMAAGGVRAIVWTNVFQALMFLAAGGLTLAFIVSQVDGGLGAVLRVAGEVGRLNVVNWGPAPGAPDFWRRIFSDPNIVWVALLNGFIGSMAAFGTDQDLMQRLLTVETRGQSQRTLSITPIGTALTLAIYLGLGAALFTYYAQHPTLAVSRPDAILPHFVEQMMPAVLRGLMLSAIVLASIDSPLGALASSFVTDIYRPLVARGRSETHYLRVSRVSVAVFGVMLGVLAYGFSFFDRILWLAFKIAGVTFGSLLGVFLLGLLTRRRVADGANVLAMVVMAVVNLVLLALIETGRLPLAWSWLVIIGTAGTMLLAVMLTGRRGAPSEPPHPRHS
jgi:SSS family solute:Na+ symporter